MDQHNLAYSLESCDFPTSGRMGQTPNGFLFGWGTTVGNGVQNWAPGAFFIQTDGSGQTLHYVNSGTVTAASWVPLTNSFTAQAMIPIPLSTFLIEDGSQLTTFVDAASAVPGIQQVSNKEICLRWNNHATPGYVITQFALPQDFDNTANLVIHWLAKMSAATDSPVLEHEVYLNAGDTDCAGTDPEVTGGTSLLEYTAAVAAADLVATPPGTITLNFHPKNGELGTDDLLVYAVWAEYTRKTLTS